jgi:hypothetical protein
MEPPQLNYQPSHSAVYYTPPRRLNVGRTLLSFAIAMFLAVIGAFAYAKIQPALHHLLLRIGQVIAGAIIAGVISMIPADFGKVRSPVLAAFMGAVLAMIVLYVMWITWIHDVLHRAGAPVEYWKLIAHPPALFRLIRLISSVGTWSYGGDMVRGFGLVIMWVLEASAVLACGVLFPLKAVGNDDPVCHSCGSQCRLVRPIARFSLECRDLLIADVENRHFNSITSYPPPPSEDAPQLSLRLLSCPRCGQTNVVTMNDISWTLDEHAQRKLDIRPIINQLMVTPEEAQVLRDGLKQIADQPSSS